jgi:hypothetical protein
MARRVRYHDKLSWFLYARPLPIKLTRKKRGDDSLLHFTGPRYLSSQSRVSLMMSLRSGK